MAKDQDMLDSPKRRWPRRPHASRAVVFFDNKTWVCKTVELSPGGILISLPSGLNKGDSVIIHFLIPDLYVRARAQVLYLMPDETTPNYSRVGLGFTLILESTKSALEKYST